MFLRRSAMLLLQYLTSAPPCLLARYLVSKYLSSFANLFPVASNIRLTQLPSLEHPSPTFPSPFLLRPESHPLIQWISWPLLEDWSSRLLPRQLLIALNCSTPWFFRVEGDRYVHVSGVPREAIQISSILMEISSSQPHLKRSRG